MGLFTKTPKVGADGYERKSVQGYAHKGPVAKLLAEGWEIEHAQNVMLGKVTMQQCHFLLKRKVSG